MILRHSPYDLLPWFSVQLVRTGDFFVHGVTSLTKLCRPSPALALQAIGMIFKTNVITLRGFVRLKDSILWRSFTI
jgi:hypothetical protein